MRCQEDRDKINALYKSGNYSMQEASYKVDAERKAANKIKLANDIRNSCYNLEDLCEILAKAIEDSLI